MTTIERISKFRPELLTAFEKMILGINVELSDQGRATHGNHLTGRWFFITAIEADESITLQSQTHTISSGCYLSDIKL